MTKPKPDLPGNVVEALRLGNKAEAIRLMREFQQGLKTAKAHVGALRKPHAPHTAYAMRRPGLSPGEVPRTGGGSAWIVALVIGALVTYYLLSGPQ